MLDDCEVALGRLQVIATLLGIPLEGLFAGMMPERLWADNECLRLWHSLKTDAGRDTVLDALRRTLDEERG